MGTRLVHMLAFAMLLRFLAGISKGLIGSAMAVECYSVGDDETPLLQASPPRSEEGRSHPFLWSHRVTHYAVGSKLRTQGQ